MSKRARTIVVLPDRHFGLHDEDPIPWHATEVAMRAIEYLKADETVVLGDWLDGASCSSHAASSMREMLHQGYMETEVVPCQKALDRIQATSKRLVYLEGNHEQRVLRWALSQISRGPIGDVVQSLAPRELLARTAAGKARKNFTWVSYIGPLPRYNIAPNLIAIHGWSCAANAAKAHLDKARSSSVVHGHTHRRQEHVSRDPMTGAMFYGWSPGALCTMLPDYRSNNPTDWCYGFTVIYQSRARPEDWTHYNVTISPDGRRAVLPDGHTITV